MNNGGPAFPAPAGVAHITEQGMTLRDYFAAKAMSTYLKSKTATDLLSGGFMATAMVAYEMADAMLKVRSQ